MFSGRELAIFPKLACLPIISNRYIINRYMAQRSSSSMEVLLGLLAIESMSGYDLGLTIRGSIGYFWNESYGQIYPNLKKLAGGGFVSYKTERKKGKPDRRIYSITEKGRERLTEWLTVPPQAEIPRNELLLKLFFGEQVPMQVLIGYVERMAGERRALLEFLERAECEEIDKNQHYPGAPYWRMAAHYGQMEMRAHLHWAEETLAELNKIARKRQSYTEARQEKKHARK
jgi:PadR family transcriptional regulator AphA